MLGIVSMAGNALKALGNVHPAVKWGVIILAGLLAVELIGREGIALYRDMATTPAQVEQAKAAEVEAQNARITAHLNSIPMNVVRQWEDNKRLLRDKALTTKLPQAPAEVRACYDALKAITPDDPNMVQASDGEKQDAQADCWSKLIAFRNAAQ